MMAADRLRRVAAAAAGGPIDAAATGRVARSSAIEKPALDLAALERAILNAPVEWREHLARHFAPSALRSARLAERDGLLLRMALGRNGDATALAEMVHAGLSRYATSAWRYEEDRAAPAEERHALAHRVLTLTDGEVLSVRSLRLIFRPVARKSDRRAKPEAARGGPPKNGANT